MKYIKGWKEELLKNNKSKDKTFVSIDYSDLEKDYDFSDFSPMIFFLSTNYNNINDKDPLKWESMVKPVNDMLALLTKEEQYEIIKTFDVVIKLINSEFELINVEYSVSRIIMLMRQVGRLLLEMENKIKICDRIEKYITDSIYIGDFKKAGMNPQDRAAVTYKEEDAKELMIIAILSKLLFPIYGYLIINIKSCIDRAREIKNKYPEKIKLDIEELRLKKEVYVSIILDQILENRFKEANEKLDMYVTDYVNRQYDDMKILEKVEKENDIDTASKEYTSGTFYSGTTTSNLIMFTKANLLIKAFVNGNINDNTRSNIMSYVHNSVFEMINKKLNDRNKHPIFRRMDISKKQDKETPQLEIDSVTSETSLDILGIIDNEITKVSESLVVSLGKEELYEKVLKYHLYNSVHPTYINKLVLCTFFGPKLGGGTSILYLNHNRFCELISAMQIYLLDMNAYELLHAMSANPIGKKEELNKFDIILSNKHKTPRYKECLIKFKHVESLFKSSMDNFIGELTQNDYVLNTPDCIYDYVGVDNMNGTPMFYSLNIINDMLFLMNL